jgi:thiol-disulfide isomerase/thioredoxin
MIMRVIFIYSLTVTAIMLLLLMAGCTEQSDRKSTPAAGIMEMSQEKRQMPSFNLPSPLSEDSITSSESFKGKVVLVSFFTSWCKSCLEEIPVLKKLQSRFSDQGFVVVALAIDSENELGLKNLIQKQNINYPVLLADEAVKKDFGGIAILPTMFLVDRDGKFLKKYFGHIDRDSLIEDIKRTLKL